MALREEAAVHGVEPLLERRPGEAEGRRAGAGEQRRVARRLGRLHEEPARLDVVTVGHRPVERRPALVEEQQEVRGRGVDDAVEVEADALAQPLPQDGVGPGPQEGGVGLHHVQVRVHRLRRVLVLLAQAHVVERAPVARAGLPVAAPGRLRGVGLDRAVEGDRALLRLHVARREVVLGEGVERERESVGLLPVGERLPRGVEHPVRAAVALVPEAGDELGEGALGHPPVRGVAGPTVGGGEGPEDARAQHPAPGGRGVVHALVAHQADEAAPLLVDRLAHPEREHVAEEVALHGGGQEADAVLRSCARVHARNIY